MFTGRLMAISLTVAGVLLAQPSVTTIQDTIYKADGSRFNGTAVISWSTFTAGDSSNIGMQSVSVPIVNGALYVQLVPTTNSTPTNIYSVHYNSDGVVQFTETWSVPATTNVLRVRDVRVGASTGTSGNDTTTPATIAETQVTGLPIDLLIRPVIGSGYAAGLSAVINSAGEIEAVAGNAGDCVRVDGSASTCFDTTSLASFVDNETLTGAVDGVNTYFMLQSVPVPSTSLSLFRNGIYQKAAVDYTVTSNSIRFLTNAVPQTGDILVASYRIAGLRTTATQQINTTFPLVGGGSLQNTLTVSLADSAFLRRGHRAVVLGDGFAGSGASWAISANWFAQAAVQSRSSIRYIGNAGVAGNTAASMLSRLSTDVLSLYPDKVFIAAGSSDIAAGTQPATIVATVGSIVSALKTANVLPIICGVPPVAGYLSSTLKFNLLLRKLADQQGIPFVDLASAVTDPTTGFITTAYGTDSSNLGGVANRLLSSSLIAGVSSLFDTSYPWIPSSDKDPNNLVLDPLFQNSPSKWTQTTVSGSVATTVSIAADYLIRGNVAAMNKQDRGSVNQIKGAAITSGFSPGDRIAFVGRIRTSSVEYNGLSFDVGLQFSPGVNVFYPMYHWTADISDGQWYVETVVPDGVTSITPFFQLNQGAGTITVGQIGILNLTALGL